MFYIEFISGSENHINWLRKELKNKIYVSGHITKSKINSAFQLKYAKKEALVIIKKMYYILQFYMYLQKKVKIY